jgi:[CysO sulfur-carrier protein]-S-L-cysteine hydrolase
VGLTVDRRALTVLERVVEVAAPAEGCALVLGTTGSHWHLDTVWPCCNSWPVEAERRRRFSLDPREQLQAQRWARQRGLAVLGSAHSHPHSAPQPSRLDRRLCVPPALMLIGGRDGQAAGGGWLWRCWWLQEADAAWAKADPDPRALQLPWRMVG